MTTSDARTLPAAPVGPQRPAAALGWVAPASFVAAGVLWNGGACAIDGSPLATPSEAWGYAFATVIVSTFVGLPLLLLVALPGCVALVQRSAPPAGLRFSTWVSGLTAVGMAFLGVVAVLGAVAGAGAGELVFGLLTLATAGGLLVPAYVVSRALAAPAGR